MVESSEAEETSSAWLVAIVGATLCWGIADVMCDICIGEDDDDEEEDEEVGLELASMRHQERSAAAAVQVNIHVLDSFVFNTGTP